MSKRLTQPQCQCSQCHVQTLHQIHRTREQRYIARYQRLTQKRLLKIYSHFLCGAANGLGGLCMGLAFLSNDFVLVCENFALLCETLVMVSENFAFVL